MAENYVKVKVDVELRGVLSCTGEAVTVSTDAVDRWVLDFGEDREMRATARSLDGKTVVVKGSAILRGIQSTTTRDLISGFFGGAGVTTDCVLDLEPKVAVKNLVAATKE
jgi:hypothetical protein